MDAPRPLGLLVCLLRAVSSRDAANAAIGDLFEDLADRRTGNRGPRLAAVRLNLQIVRMIVAAIRANASRSTRSLALIGRDAVRLLRAAPAHALFVVLVLAVGVTTGTVTFSVVDAVVLKPLPLAHPEQLVAIAPRDADGTVRITAELFRRLRDHLSGVAAVAPLMTMTGETVRIDDLKDEWPVTFASADIFRVLQWSPAIGRFWTDEEEQRGEIDVAVVGYRFWRQHFNGDASVLGAAVSTGTRTYRVIGVLPEGSDRPEIDLGRAPIWVPHPVTHGASQESFGIIARMASGISPGQLSDEIQRVAGVPGWRPAVAPLHDRYVAPVRQWMFLALGAAAGVVLIACVNAANLMLTRTTRRTQEMAIRASIGASRRQIAATVLVEGLLLSTMAALLALLFSVAAIGFARFAVTTMLPSVFRASMISLNGRVLTAAIIAAVLTGLLVALVPAWQAARAPLSTLLKDGAGAITTRQRWRGIFLTAEVATVTVLLVISWLFIVSLIHSINIDLGIDRTNLVAVQSRTDFGGTVDEVEQRLRRVPGVLDVAVSTGASLPLVGSAFGGAWTTRTLQRADDRGNTSSIKVLQYSVSHNYFSVAGLPFGRGGTWAPENGADAGVVVLDERAARQLFGEEDPLGRQLRVVEPVRVFTVIGTVPHVYARGPEAVNQPSAYFPLRPSPTRTFGSLFVKTSRPAERMLSSINEALKPVAPDTKDPFVFLADEALGRITATRRFSAGLMSAFGLVGVLIGAAGVYAVMASFVAQQTREIGIRLALGASPGRIRRGVLLLAWRHLAAGLALGLPVAWWTSRGFAALLFRVTPADLSVYLGVVALMSVVASTAAWIPARRAAEVDPIISLRR